MQSHLNTDLEIWTYIAQLPVIVRMVFSNFTVKEDLLRILSMKGPKTGEDIYNILRTYAIDRYIFAQAVCHNRR